MAQSQQWMNISLQNIHDDPFTLGRYGIFIIHPKDFPHKTMWMDVKLNRPQNKTN